MSTSPSNEIQATKKQFLVIVTGEYLITGFFWVFSTLGSLLLSAKKDTARTLFFTMFVLMISNGIWEILTGWYADKFRRQFSISAGFLACLVGFLLMGLAGLFAEPRPAQSDFSFVFLVWLGGVSIWSLGPALLSGAQEAWLVDRCNFFSQDPPEDFDSVFKKSAAYGVVAKSIGAAACVLIFYPGFTSTNPHSKPAFVISAGIASGISAWLLLRSRELREEYWSHPKYQTNESLFFFLGQGLQDLWRTPYRWFTLSYVGAMGLNYVVSPTVWPYLVSKRGGGATLLEAAGILILAELSGSFLSRSFSKQIDGIRRHWLRMPIASLMYLAPILFMIYSPIPFFYILVAAAFSFRTVHASVFGTLNTIGQQAIKSDERRAILISMSSAISSFLMSIVFIVFFALSNSSDLTIDHQIQLFWRWVPLPCILILIWGGYLAARPHTEGR